MNKKLGCIKGEIFTNEANFTEMIECRFANCSHPRNNTQGFVKKNSNVTCFRRSQHSLITVMNMWQGRWSTCTDIKKSSVLSLLNFNLFRSIQVSISRTQASKLRLLSSISLRDDVSKINKKRWKNESIEQIYISELNNFLYLEQNGHEKKQPDTEERTYRNPRWPVEKVSKKPQAWIK